MVGAGFTQIPKKKIYIKIMNSDELVFLHLFPVNLVHHCNAGSTAHGGPRLVRKNNFFFKQKSNKKKIIIKKYFVNFSWDSLMGCSKRQTWLTWDFSSHCSWKYMRWYNIFGLFFRERIASALLLFHAVIERK